MGVHATEPHSVNSSKRSEVEEPAGFNGLEPEV